MSSNVSISAQRNLLENLELFIELIKRELKTRYKNTLFGKLWFVLHPLLIASTFILIRIFFLDQFEICSISLIDFYLLLVLWLFFVMAIQNSINSLTIEHKLISNFKLPIFFVPLSIVVASFIAALVNFGIYYFLLFIFEKKLFLHVTELLPVFLVSFVFVASFCIIFAFLQRFISDLKLLIPFFVRLGLLWLPYFYDLSVVPERVKTFYINIPMVWAVLKTKEIFLGNGYGVIYDPIYMLLFSMVLLLLTIFITQKFRKYAVSVTYD